MQTMEEIVSWNLSDIIEEAKKPDPDMVRIIQSAKAAQQQLEEGDPE